MNKMNMPGFTAGASLYPAVSHYRTFSISNVPCDAVELQMTKNQLLDFMKFFAESAAGGPGSGGGSTPVSDCLVSCYRRYLDCMGSGQLDPEICERKFNLCNGFCFSPLR
jgi:hypothetical protein